MPAQVIFSHGSKCCSEKALGTVTESIRRLVAKFGHVPLLDATADLKVKASAHKKLRRKLDRLDGILEQNPLFAEYASPPSDWTAASTAKFGIV